MPVRRGFEFWAEQIQRCEESNLSQKVFCRKNGLARSTFQHWKRKLQNQKAFGSNHIVALSIDSIPHAPRPLRLHVHGGYLLEIEPGFCQQTLRDVLAVVNS